MDDREFIRLTASMEGTAAVASSLGKMVKCSEMELVFVVAAAEIGMMTLFSELEGEVGDNAKEEVRRIVAGIRTAFGKPGHDGLRAFMNGAAAVMRSDKFHRFTPPLGD